MSVPSELVEMQVVDGHGKTSTFYTYDGYYSEDDRRKVRDYRCKVERRTYSAAFLSGLFAYYTSRKTNMADFSCRSYRVRKRGLLSGVAGFVGGLLAFDFLGTQLVADFEKGIALNSKNLPLWSSRQAAVNPDRAYFQLVDAQNNEPCIFHSGLTPESAAELIPDRVIGVIPPKPHLHNIH